MAKVIIRKPAYNFEFNNPDGMVGKYLAKKGRRLEVLAKAQAGVRTGALRASIHMRHARDPRGQYVMVGSRLNYALMHHEGTKPHLIVANSAKVLRFVKGSSIVYAHSVMHPGTKANRYLSDNLRKVM